MNPDAVLKILQQVGAIITEGHFVYTSGKHGHAYINKDALYPHTEQVKKLCAVMAENFCDASIDTVVGPTMGGIILAQWVADALSRESGRPVMACFAEERRVNGEKQRYFGRGYEKYVTGQRVLIVEDILNTGGSVRQVVEAVQAAGGAPVAISALCNRGGVMAEDVGGVPLHALLDLKFEAWEPGDCPLCRKGIPVSTELGKGR